MKRIIGISLRVALCVGVAAHFPFSSFHSLAAQDTSMVSVKIYGFVRNYLTFDSRRTYTVIGGEYNMIPFDEHWNEDHSEDLNGVASMQLQALTSRFGVDITGPALWGWNTSGKLEGLLQPLSND